MEQLVPKLFECKDAKKFYPKRQRKSVYTRENVLEKTNMENVSLCKYEKRCTEFPHNFKVISTKRCKSDSGDVKRCKVNPYCHDDTVTTSVPSSSTIPIPSSYSVPSSSTIPIPSSYSVPSSVLQSVSQPNTVSLSTKSSQRKNIYHHDDVFWTTNLYGKKKVKTLNLLSTSTNISTKCEKTKNNPGNNSLKCTVVNSKPEVIPPLPTCRVASLSVTSTCTNPKSSTHILKSSQGEKMLSSLTIVTPSVNSNVLLERECNTVLSEQSNMQQKNKVPVTEYKLSVTSAIPVPSDSIIMSLKGCSNDKLLTSQSKCCTPVQLASNTFSTVEECGSNQSKPDSMLDDSPSSMDCSEYNFEDPLPAFTSVAESTKVRRRAACNKNNEKESGKAKKSNSILNYFTKTNSPKEEKPVKPVPEQIKSTESVLKKKKAAVISGDPPMFDLPVSPHLHSKCKASKKCEKKSPKTNKKEQMYIDIGQTDFGHVKCGTCGMIYTKSQEDDEAQHAKFHQKVIQKLYFKGWKSERVLEKFHDGRIIMIQHDDHPCHIKKLLEVEKVVDAELGFATAQNLYPKSEQQAFLFIMAKKIVGCAIAIPIRKAYPVIAQKEDTNSRGEGSAPSSWCCSTEPVSAVCGISRVWVFSHNRRQKIASRLVDCIRYNFLYGYIIPKDKIAFSDPTPTGRVFAESYTTKSDILVFR